MKTVNAVSLFTLAPRTVFRRLQAWFIRYQIRTWEEAKADIRRFRLDGVSQERQIEKEQLARHQRLRELQRPMH